MTRRDYHRTISVSVFDVNIVILDENAMKLRYRPGAARRYAPADGSSTVAKIAGSTSVRVRVRSPHISCGQWWLSCMQPACL